MVTTLNEDVKTVTSVEGKHLTEGKTMELYVVSVELDDDNPDNTDGWNYDVHSAYLSKPAALETMRQLTSYKSKKSNILTAIVHTTSLLLNKKAIQMNWPIESSVKALKEYKEAQGSIDIAESADYLAQALEEFLRVAAEIDLELACTLQKANQPGQDDCAGNRILPEGGNYLVNLPITLSQEDIDDIMCTACEGGINSWCCGAEIVEKLPDGTPDYKGRKYFYEVLTRGGSFKIFTPKGDWPEENDEPILTIERFLKGFEAWTKMRVDNGNPAETDPANIDAGDASAIIEMALFGRIMYC